MRETKNQIDDLMEEIRKRVEVEERTLVTTLTKKMAEDLTDYLLEYGFKVRYLHSEIDTLERIQIIRELRLGEFDILVGVNLLREGLDLPEVSLVAILDADKEGFLRGETSLIQTIGRAARNIRGKVIMYADKETAAMRKAIKETDRRRAIQVAYNEEHGITPATIQKGISDISDFLMQESKVPTGRGRRRRDTEGMTAEELRRTIVELEEEMLAAADDLRFEYAAKLRDEIKALRRELAGGRGKRLRRVFCYTPRAAESLLTRRPVVQDRPPTHLRAGRARSALLLCARAARAGGADRRRSRCPTPGATGVGRDLTSTSTAPAGFTITGVDVGLRQRRRPSSTAPDPRVRMPTRHRRRHSRRSRATAARQRRPTGPSRSPSPGNAAPTALRVQPGSRRCPGEDVLFASERVRPRRRRPHPPGTSATAVTSPLTNPTPHLRHAPATKTVTLTVTDPYGGSRTRHDASGRGAGPPVVARGTSRPSPTSPSARAAPRWATRSTSSRAVRPGRHARARRPGTSTATASSTTRAATSVLYTFTHRGRAAPATATRGARHDQGRHDRASPERTSGLPSGPGAKAGFLTPAPVIRLSGQSSRGSRVTILSVRAPKRRAR